MTNRKPKGRPIQPQKVAHKLASYVLAKEWDKIAAEGVRD